MKRIDLDTIFPIPVNGYFYLHQMHLAYLHRVSPLARTKKASPHQLTVYSDGGLDLAQKHIQMLTIRNNEGIRYYSPSGHA